MHSACTGTCTAHTRRMNGACATGVACGQVRQAQRVVEWVEPFGRASRHHTDRPPGAAAHLVRACASSMDGTVHVPGAMHMGTSCTSTRACTVRAPCTRQAHAVHVHVLTLAILTMATRTVYRAEARQQGGDRPSRHRPATAGQHVEAIARQLVAWGCRLWHGAAGCGMGLQAVAWGCRLWHGAAGCGASCGRLAASAGAAGAVQEGDRAGGAGGGNGVACARRAHICAPRSKYVSSGAGG